MADVIRDGMVVSLAYTLKLKDGESVDSASVEDPLEYLHGHENIVPGLEKELTGLKVGDKKDVVVSPTEGYGEYDPEDVETMDRSAIPQDYPVEVGMMIAVETDEGEILEATIREIKGKDVTLDFNPPLAGETLYFSIEIVGIREATEEELENGFIGDDFDDEDDFYDEDDLDVEFDDELDGEFDEMLEDDEDDGSPSTNNRPRAN